MLAPQFEVVFMSAVSTSGERVNSPLLYSINDARAILGGLSRTWIHAQIAAGRIRAVKMGRRTMIPVAEVEALAAVGAEQ